MSLRSRTRPHVWGMVLATSLSIPPAHARENVLVIRSPEPDAVQTVVTGQGPAASVAMPDGPASMTPRWLVARADLRWTCPDSKAVALEVKTDKGPNARPRTFELLRTHGLHGASTQMELYLWEVSAVKAACASEGEVHVDSVPVKLTLRCEDGQVFQHQQVIPLQARCRPLAPSEEAVTGLTGSENERDRGSYQQMLGKFALMTPDLSPSELSLGKKGTLEFSDVLRRAWTPEFQALRVVKLGAKGEILERQPPVPLSGDPEDPVFAPRLTLTPRKAETLRFALEAEYPDGSRLISQPAEVRVLTPKQQAAQAARVIPPARRMQFLEELQKQMGALDCGPVLIEWIQKQPVIEDAGLSKDSGLWYRFSDGQMGIVHCH
ncbi:hypothetical protein F0U61_33050 [Archangium violaceum]|uniref:hypothetical protein n=1 Tax=Archangium violaceum TaxID=83451 RepID=UPI002B29575A|nr:hypothetical protein F0U61_33050 [Archangium violaceum]